MISMGTTTVTRRALPALLSLLLVLAGLTLTAATGTGVAQATTPWPGGTWVPDQPAYGMTVVKNVPITMDDGVILRATIGYPANLTTGQRSPGRFPVLVTQDPYIGLNIPFHYFVNRGYIYVSVTVRGTGNSSAPHDAPLANPFFGPRAGRDGAEIVEWAAHRLSGSNGTIGLIGCSFLGITQLFTAAALGPNSPVKAMVPACSYYGYDAMFSGGIPSTAVALSGIKAAGIIMGAPHLAANAASGLAMHDNILAGGAKAYDGAYWQARTTTPQMAAKIVSNGIPALLWSGWKALDVTGSLELFAAFQNAATGRPIDAPMIPGQRTTGRYQIIVGPGIHGQGLDQGLMLEWYDTWLKHQKTGMTDTRTPAHVYETGSNRWVNAPSYPMAATYTPYYLGSHGTLTAQPSTGSAGSDAISWAAPTEPNSTLTYNSPAFAKGASLDGPIAASIYASSSNRNLELIATLTDVAPDGTTVKLTNGTVLGALSSIDPKTSWRDGQGLLTKPVHPYAADHYIPAGQVHRYDIKLTPTVHAVAPGHSLRLTLSTQSSLSDCLNPVGPTQPCLLTAPQKATVPGGIYQIERSDQYRSVVTLPLLPAGTFPTARSGVTPTSLGETEPLGW